MSASCGPPLALDGGEIRQKSVTRGANFCGETGQRLRTRDASPQDIFGDFLLLDAEPFSGSRLGEPLQLHPLCYRVLPHHEWKFHINEM